MDDRQNILNAKIPVVDGIAANLALIEQILRENGYRHIASTTDPRAVVELHRVDDY